MTSAKRQKTPKKQQKKTKESLGRNTNSAMCEWNGVYIELWHSLADTALEAHLALGVEEQTQFWFVSHVGSLFGSLGRLRTEIHL